jgi:hypothetical protein
MFRKFGTDKADFSATVRRAMRWLDDPSVLPIVDAAARQAWHPARYVLCGWYSRAIARWLEVFPREQCLFLISEEFFADPVSVSQMAARHIGLPDGPIQSLPVARDGGYAERMAPDVEAELRAFYALRNVELSTLLGRELPWA